MTKLPEDAFNKFRDIMDEFRDKIFEFPTNIFVVPTHEIHYDAENLKIFTLREYLSNIYDSVNDMRYLSPTTIVNVFTNSVMPEVVFVTLLFAGTVPYHLTTSGKVALFSIDMDDDFKYNRHMNINKIDLARTHISEDILRVQDFLYDYFYKVKFLLRPYCLDQKFVEMRESYDVLKDIYDNFYHTGKLEQMNKLKEYAESLLRKEQQ